MNTPDLTLYYDGLCPLCSREIAYYRRRAGADPGVHFEDITAPGFDAKALGLDPVRIHRHIHARVGDEILTGVDAFIAVWGRIRGHAWLARLARLPGVYHLLWGGYYLFALVRPLLPRRKSGCDGGACQR